MDFFATGGFQQLFNDLEDSEFHDGATDFTHNLDGYTTLESYDYCTASPVANNNNLIRLTCADDPFVLAGTNNEQTVLELHVDWCGATLDATCCTSECNNNSTSSEGTYTYEYRVINEQELQLNLDQLLVSTPVSINELGCSSNKFPNTEAVSQCTEDEPNNTSSAESLESNSFHELETAAFITREMAEWEAKFLDNYIEIPELIDFLPEKTPLCTETCEHFLHESSKNLKLHRKMRTKKRSHELLNTSAEDRTAAGYTCNFGTCKKVYAKPAHLKAHMRRHMGEKPYICNWPECTWKFSRSDELARHRRSHSGVKPYKCNYCMKCFARSDHLTKHRKVHERRLLAASKAGKTIDGVLPHSVFTVRPGRKRKNQIC